MSLGDVTVAANYQTGGSVLNVNGMSLVLPDLNIVPNQITVYQASTYGSRAQVSGVYSITRASGSVIGGLSLTAGTDGPWVSGDFVVLQIVDTGGGSSLSLTTTGSSGAATLTGSVLNVPNYATGGTPGGTNGQLQYNNSGAFGGRVLIAADIPSTGLLITQHSALIVVPSGTSGTVTLDLSAGDVFIPGIMTGNVTLALSNPPSSGKVQSFRVVMQQAASGGPYAITFFANVAWIGDTPWTAPTMPTTASAYLEAVFEYLNSGLILGHYLGTSAA